MGQASTCARGKPLKGKANKILLGYEYIPLCIHVLAGLLVYLQILFDKKRQLQRLIKHIIMCDRNLIFGRVYY